ncbi:hypothetical protein F5887DRAFT_988340 [Amanita rubescens]|nr:hypothetical protein F5887DRAFT_988340 [Amanita rubescens]
MSQALPQEQLKSLQSLIAHHPPFCSGTLPVTQNDLVLYYGKEENACRLNLFHPSQEALQQLSRACDPATFGLNKEDVYDESYRKAGKLSSGEFCPTLDVVSCKLMNIVRENLLYGHQAQRQVRAELYNLNVYGENSFFKAHVDTPRSTHMFGSLVVFFPTSYEGGSLIMRRNGEKWSFDAAKELAECEEPHIAYVAIYSDVEHEVSTVTSGYRVTVTYNLYFDDEVSAPTFSAPLSPGATKFRDKLETLLLDSTFLPNGGLLGFDMEHYYPVQNDTSTYVDLRHVGQCLKGTDAEIMAIANYLSLHVSVRGLVTFDEEDGTLLAIENEIPAFNAFGFSDDGENAPGYLISEGAKVVEVSKYDDHRRHMHVNWVTRPSKLNQKSKMYAYYGNGAQAAYSYNSFCLFVEVGMPGQRSLRPDLKKPDGPDSEDSNDDSDEYEY